MARPRCAWKHGGLVLIFTVTLLIKGSRGIHRHQTKKSPKSHQKSGVSPTERSFPETLELDHEMSAFLENNRYTGATLGVASGNQLRYTQGYGETDEGIPMRPTSMQPISSLSKTITAVAVLKLMELGCLRLTDHIFGPDGILSSFQPSDGIGVDPHLKDITVEHLLQHSAGWSQSRPQLYDPMMNPVYLSRGHDVIDIAMEMQIEHDLTPRDVISFMMQQPLDHPPGIKYDYSNLGYCVLGRVIEQVSGQSYADFVTSNILEPLGMWHTQIGPQKVIPRRNNNHIPVINFFEGSIPLSNTQTNLTTKFYLLLDSTLGWWSTVYDLMRFVTGLTSGMVLKSESLKLMTQHPPAPVSEHRDTWHGLGVQADGEAAWWQLGDPHDNEIILYHQEFPAPTRSRHSKIQKFQRASVSWLVILSDNNRKNLRQTFHRMMSKVKLWPPDNLLIEDCGEFLPRRSWEHSTLMNSQIRETTFPLFIKAAARLQYHPVWINAYNINHKTFFAAIFKSNTENEIRTVEGATKSELINLRMDNLMEGSYLNFVTSYNSNCYEGSIRYGAIFSQTPSTSAQLEIGETYKDFQMSLDESKNKHVPTTQSMVSVDGTQYITYSLSEKKSHGWKSFVNLTLEQLQLQVRENANMDRALSYLDSYVHLGRVYFSAVFSSQRAAIWQVQTEVRHDQLSAESLMFQGFQLGPRIVVGYECKGLPCFVILWRKH